MVIAFINFESVQKQWMRAVEHQRSNSTLSYFLCSKHFETECFIANGIINRNYSTEMPQIQHCCDEIFSRSVGYLETRLTHKWQFRWIKTRAKNWLELFTQKDTFTLYQASWVRAGLQHKRLGNLGVLLG